MSEGYLVAKNSHYTLEPPWLVGQSFRPTESHKLNFIDLRIRKLTIGGELYCTVHDLATDPNMTGGGISTAKFTTYPRAWPWDFAPVRFTMRPAALLVDHDYALALRAEPAPAWNKPDIACRVGDGAYPRGEMFTKEDPLAPPVYRHNDDLMFAEYGEPPTPTPTPPPPFLEWILTDIKQTQLADGYRIVVATNVPVHLWLRWSTKKPWIHRVPRLVRGTYVLTDFYYCFTVYTDLEQIEAGDTLYHTFEMHDWPVCQTRWFYFYGTVDNVNSPSTSPLFDKHFSYVAPPPEKHKFLWSKPTTALVGKIGLWPAVWTAESDYNPAQDQVAVVPVHENYYRRNVMINRTFMAFDTTEIPPEKTIISGLLHVYIGGINWKHPHRTVILQALAPGIPHYPTAKTDYNKAHFSGNLASFIPQATMTYQDVPLNAAGLAAINKGGITHFGCRFQADVDGIDPTPWGVGSHRCVIYIDESPPNNRYCYLELEY